MQSNQYPLTEMWKERAKTRHTVVGIRTWHVNLNPRAMPSLGRFRQRTVAETRYPDSTRRLAGSLRNASRGVNCGNHHR